TLIQLLKERLINEGRKPYVIPLGGSNSLGIWAYIEAARELDRRATSYWAGKNEIRRHCCSMRQWGYYRWSVIGISLEYFAGK
ncbi:hypothetical protein MKX01_023061, partial [Papaver californicum]